MKSNIKISFFILIGIISSCSANREVNGLYGKCEKGYFACSQILLKSDNTFEYFEFYDVGGKKIRKGTWRKISNDSIIINTYKQPKISSTTYIGKVNPDISNTVKVKISDANGPFANVNVVLNSKDGYGVTNENGIVVIETQSIETIEYSILNRKEKIEIDNPHYNEIEILIKDIDNEMEFLTDYGITVQGKKLILDSNYVYHKTGLRNKQWR